jgi:hypothetical protein
LKVGFGIQKNKGIEQGSDRAKPVHGLILAENAQVLEDPGMGRERVDLL